MTSSEAANQATGQATTAPSPAVSPGQTVIEIEDLSVVYDGGPRGDIHALHHIDLTANKGDFLCLVGRSGCGKSTLLKTIAGFVEPTAGVVRVSGKEVRQPGRDRGMVFQEYALFPWRTALKNVAFGLEQSGIDKRAALQRAREYLELVRLDGFEDVYPHQLSGGMKQRVAIARALAYGPEILLMDEPFAAVDAFTRQQLQSLMVEVWQNTGATVFYVTHDIPEAIFLSERVVVMTPQPGEISAVRDVNLPRPRDPLDPEVSKLAREVRELVFEER